jgi:ABC-type uncharacterized transport system permease subunit
MDFLANITFALTVACSCCAAWLCISSYLRGVGGTAIRSTREAKPVEVGIAGSEESGESMQSASNRSRRLFLLLSLVGLSVLTGLGWNQVDGVLYSAPNIFLLVAWALCVLYVCFEFLGGGRNFGALVMPLVVLATLIGWFAALAPSANQVQAVAVYQDWPLLVVHVGAFILAAVCFLIGGVASVLLLRQMHQLKRDKAAALHASGPSLTALQKVAVRSATVGLPILTVGLLLGITQGFLTGQLDFANAGVFFSARILVSCLLWSCYVVYLVMTHLLDASWRVASWVAIIGSFVTLLIVVLSALSPMLGA